MKLNTTYVLLSLLPAIVVGSGCIFSYNQYQATLHSTNNELNEIATHAAINVEVWRSDLQQQADSILMDELLMAGLVKGCSDKAKESEKFQIALDRIRSLLHGHDAENLLLLDPSGNVCWGNTSVFTHFSQDLIEQVTPEESDSGNVLANAHLCNVNENPQLSFTISIPWPDSVATEVSGSLLISIDLTKRLYPMLRPWKNIGRTDELGLMRRVDDHIEFISPTRFDDQAAMKRRVPLTETRISIVRALLGLEEITNGVDYRGVRVLSAVRQVPGSDWFVFAEIDHKEAFKEWREQLVLITLLMLLVVLSTYLGGVALWQRALDAQRNTIDRVRNLHEQTLSRLEEVSLHSRTMSWEVDPSGLYTYVSRGCETLTGFSVTELVGEKHFYDLHPAEGREEFKQASFEVIAARKAFNNLPNRILRSDGITCWVLTNGYPVIDADGRFMGYRGSDRDITDLSVTQQELQNSEERNRVIIEGTSEGLLVAELKTQKPVFCNPAMCRMLGYSNDELLTMNVHELHPAESWAEIDMHFSKMLNERTQINTEVPFRRKDGSVFIASVTSHEIYLNGERHAAGFFRDLTAQKQLEYSLLRSQSMANMGTWEINHKTSKLSWTPEVYRIFEVEDSTTQSLYEAYFERVHRADQASLFKAHYGALKNNGRYQVTYRIDCPIAGMKWIEETGEVELGPDLVPIQSWGTVQDITIRRARNERILLQSAALEASPAGIIITNFEGGIEWFNSSFERLSGYTLQECLGVNLYYLQLVNVTDSFLYGDLLRSARTGSGVSAELESKRKDGSIYMEHLTITPITNFEQITHFVVIKQDITERKSLEAQYLQAQKMESVGRLAGGIAHDFNNILSVIIGYTEMALLQVPQDSHAIKSLEQIDKAANRAAGLTRQLLAFSRRQALQSKEVNLNELIQDIEKMLRRLLTEDISLTLQLSEIPVTTVADPGQIEQVLLNLVVNARDAMTQGGNITIATELLNFEENTQFGDSLVPEGQYVSLTVTDSGCGITPEVMSKMFEPFYTTKGQGKGTGLGLSTVFGIVKQSGGHISVNSTIGHGSKFNILLPFGTMSSAGLIESANRASLEKLGHATILLVEDDVALAEMLQRILNSVGYHVFMATTGEEALEIFQQSSDSIDLVISDVIMPAMNGPTLATAIYMLKPDIRILFMSGYTDDTLNQQRVVSGEVDLIMKPFSIDELTKRISEILTRPNANSHLTKSSPELT